MGPAPEPDKINRWLINAGKQMSLLPWSYMHHADSFALSAAVISILLRARRLPGSRSSDLANWATSDSDHTPAVGGAMDLAAGAQRIWVLMEHTTKNGESRLKRRCSYPLTAPGVVKRVYTNLAVLDVTDERLRGAGHGARSHARGVAGRDRSAAAHGELTERS